MHEMAWDMPCDLPWVNEIHKMTTAQKTHKVTKLPKVDENSLRTMASTEHCKQPITANHCVWHLPSLWEPPTSRKPQWSGPNMSGHVRICNHDYNDYRICRICGYVREHFLQFAESQSAETNKLLHFFWNVWIEARHDATVAHFLRSLTLVFQPCFWEHCLAGICRNLVPPCSSPKAKLTAWQWDTEPLRSKHIKKSPTYISKIRLSFFRIDFIPIHTPNIPQFHC